MWMISTDFRVCSHPAINKLLISGELPIIKFVVFLNHYAVYGYKKVIKITNIERIYGLVVRVPGYR
jgi:hypothetical protein